MILHPGIIALLAVSSIILLVMLYASWLGLEILFKWDRNSSSESQLLLEKRTWLVATLTNYALGFQVFSAVLFIFTADDIHRLFVGAMCATGSLNANLIGWLVLLLKGLLLFLASFWVVINRLDQHTEDGPLVKAKSVALLLLTPLVGLDLYLQWSYFTGLRPEVITSCCGSLFSVDGEGVASDLAGLPVAQAMPLFFSAIFLYLASLIGCLWFRTAILRHVLFVATVLMFFVSLGSIVSFLSLYIYQMPSHHCPFDMLQADYGYVGYPIYFGLFAATLYGMLPGICQPLHKYGSLHRQLAVVEKTWLKKALAGILVFLICSCWQMFFGSFRLLGY